VNIKDYVDLTTLTQGQTDLYNTGFNSYNRFCNLDPSPIPGMECTWTDATRLEWIKQRDIYRKQKDLPPLESLHTSDNPVHRKSYKDALSLERRSLTDRLDAYSTKTVSWPVCK
jgi:hypothetical protein